jgi:protein SCO1/2
MINRRSRLGLPVLLLVIGLVFASCGDSGPYVPAGMIRTPAPNVGSVVLPDITNGTDMALIADPGKVLIVYWGYTACPDVCPTTLSEVRKALREMGDLAESVQLAMITVDPDRDTVDVLPTYVKAFVPDGVAIRSDDPEVLAAAAVPFGAQYSVTIRDDGWVDVVHTGFLYAVDDQGVLQVTWPFGIESEDIAADLTAMLKGELPSA